MDAHVGKHIFERVISHNGLLQGKVRLLPRGGTVLRMPIRLGPKARFGVYFFCHVLADSEFPTKVVVFQQWTSTFALLSVLAEQVEGASSWILAVQF